MFNVKLFREIECIKKVEDWKQDLLNSFDYSILAIYRAIDQFSHGKITKDNLRTFMYNFDESFSSSIFVGF